MVEGHIDGYNKRYLFIRIPDMFGSLGLTLKRDVLPHGMTNADIVLLECDYASFHNNGTHYVADVKIKEVVSWKP